MNVQEPDLTALDAAEVSSMATQRRARSSKQVISGVGKYFEQSEVCVLLFANGPSFASTVAFVWFR